MDAPDLSFGCSALLRVSALPIRYWLLGANPDLFNLIRALSRTEIQRNETAAVLAESIGEQLVPNPSINRVDRAFLLHVRRRLHRGDPVAGNDHEHLRVIATSVNVSEDILENMDAVRRMDAQIGPMGDDVDARVSLEQERLLDVPSAIYRDSALARRFLPEPVPEERKRDESRSPKRRRHRFEFDWQHIERATTTSTPRGWYSHVAMIPVDVTLPSTSLKVAEDFTIQWMQDVRDVRLALTDPRDAWPEDTSMLAINPLHWHQNDHLVCVTLDHPEGPVEVSVRYTSLLESIYRSLVRGARSFEEIARTLGYSSGNEREALRGFIHHLLTLGILQMDIRPCTRRHSGTNLDIIAIKLPELLGSSPGWLDVYRQAGPGVSASLVAQVESGVAMTLRILSLTRDEVPRTATPNTLEPGTKQTFQDTVRDALKSPGIQEDREISANEEFLGHSSPGYTRLIREISRHVHLWQDVTIDAPLLDACGASDDALDWPIDCLIRVPQGDAGYTAVLDQLWPPGTIDSRFAEMLADVHGTLPHVEAYRTFLHQIEALTGYEFVELLAPPLTEGAANAVRRPLYTNAWTGDPHTGAYLHEDSKPGTYIAPADILIRRIHGKLTATVNGRPVWVVHHATRSFSSPWDRLARILLATAPIQLPWDYYKKVNNLLVFLPESPYVPRITVAGGIILAPAQWLLAAEHLWDRSLPTTAKLRALDRLRDHYSLPRWILVHPGNDRPPMPCDLESIHAIRVIERGRRNQRAVRVTEMLPAPPHFLVQDRRLTPDDHFASQIQLRFPIGESIDAMAARVARIVLATSGHPGDVPTPRMTSRRAREPPPTLKGHPVFVTGTNTEGGSS